jgi:hydroxymethylbilane synthase
LLVFRNASIMEQYVLLKPDTPFTVATSSIRRKAQWLNKYPAHNIENLRGNVNTRLEKIQRENWDAAIFAQAGLERIHLRPKESVVLDWMLPAPAQGAIAVVCRAEDSSTMQAAERLNDQSTERCTKIERDFLRTLLGGCSTPISALAIEENDVIHFKGNILSLDGAEKMEIEKTVNRNVTTDLGIEVAKELLREGGQMITDAIRNARV